MLFVPPLTLTIFTRLQTNGLIPMAQAQSKIGINVGIAITLLAAVAIGYVVYDHYLTMGTRLVIAGKEAVNYSGTATEAEARSLGEALNRIGYFDGTNEIDVLLKKSDEGTFISFVVNEQGYTDPVFIEQFKFITEQIAYSVGGAPVTLRLMSTNLSMKKELKIETSRWGQPVFITKSETVYRQGDTTEDEAKALGKALEEIEFFKGNHAKDVFLRKEKGSTTIGIVTAPAGWQDKAIQKEFHDIIEGVATSVGGKPITLQLLNDVLEVKYEHKVE